MRLGVARRDDGTSSEGLSRLLRICFSFLPVGFAWCTPVWIVSYFVSSLVRIRRCCGFFFSILGVRASVFNSWDIGEEGMGTCTVVFSNSVMDWLGISLHS